MIHVIGSAEMLKYVKQESKNTLVVECQAKAGEREVFANESQF